LPAEFQTTFIEGLIIIQPRVFPDDRGFFFESFKASEYEKNGIPGHFVQDNHSKSSQGVLRGLHFQNPPLAQGKLVRVIRGAVWDVAVDLRPQSPTRGKWLGLELSESNRTMFYIPPGFAHGFLTLQDDTEFLYKCTAEYNKASEGGIRWNDPDLAISWPQMASEYLVSDKDQVLGRFREIL
jgi:dTDP-4-dehydrorhamnose 3,5-epimerase